jgi:hypothetical protein
MIDQTREGYTSGLNILSSCQARHSTISCLFLSFSKDKEFFPTNGACFFHVRHYKHAFYVCESFNIRFYKPSSKITQ